MLPMKTNTGRDRGRGRFLKRWCLVSAVLTSGVVGQVSGFGQLTQQQRAEVNTGFANEAVSAVDVFSAADAVATGTFHYDNAGPDDVDFSTYKLPAGHTFGSATNQIRPFIDGYAGYFDLREDVTDLGPPTGKYRLQSVTLTAGGGVIWQPTDWLSATPRLLVGWGHVWQDYERNVPASDPTANILVNWHADAFVLLPSLSLDAHRSYGRWRLALNSSYTYMHSLGFYHSSSLVSLDAGSHVWRNQALARVDTGWKLLAMPVSVFSQIARYDVGGDLRQSDFVEHFYEVRVGAGFGVSKKLRPVREVDVSGAYFFEGPFRGYSVGLSLGF
jgi:hypothetical protein